MAIDIMLDNCYACTKACGIGMDPRHKEDNMNNNEQIFRDARTQVGFLLGLGHRARVEEEITLALRAEGVTRVRVTILAGRPGQLEIVAPGQERLLAMRFGRGSVSVSATDENLVEFLARARGWSPYQLR